MFPPGNERGSMGPQSVTRETPEMRSAKEIAWDVVGEARGMLYLTSDERASIALAIEKAIIADREKRIPLAGRLGDDPHVAGDM